MFVCVYPTLQTNQIPDFAESERAKRVKRKKVSYHQHNRRPIDR